MTTTELLNHVDKINKANEGFGLVYAFLYFFILFVVAIICLYLFNIFIIDNKKISKTITKKLGVIFSISYLVFAISLNRIPFFKEFKDIDNANAEIIEYLSLHFDEMIETEIKEYPIVKSNANERYSTLSSINKDNIIYSFNIKNDNGLSEKTLLINILDKNNSFLNVENGIKETPTLEISEKSFKSKKLRKIYEEAIESKIETSKFFVHRKLYRAKNEINKIDSYKKQNLYLPKEEVEDIWNRLIE